MGKKVDFVPHSKRWSPWFFFNLSTLQPINSLYLFCLWLYGLPINTKLRTRPYVTKQNKSSRSDYKMEPVVTHKAAAIQTGFCQQRFELSRHVWRSIETLFNGSGLRKNMRNKSGAGPVYQHSISPNFLFHAPARGGKSKKSAITLKYAMDAERICKLSK